MRASAFSRVISAIDLSLWGMQSRIRSIQVYACSVRMFAVPVSTRATLVKHRVARRIRKTLAVLLVAGTSSILVSGASHGWVYGAANIAFSSSAGDFYGNGQRDYSVYLSHTVGARTVTLVLIHTQQPNNGGQSGVLWRESRAVANAQARRLKGHISFSKVYFVSGAAGAPPFGTYTLTIYRGTSVRGVLLARGRFTVIED